MCGTGFIGPPPPARRMVSGSGLHELGVGMVELDAIERILDGATVIAQSAVKRWDKRSTNAFVGR